MWEKTVFFLKYKFNYFFSFSFFWGKILQILDMTKLENVFKNHELKIKNWTIFFSLFFPHFSSSSSSILSGSPVVD